MTFNLQCLSNRGRFVSSHNYYPRFLHFRHFSSEVYGSENNLFRFFLPNKWRLRCALVPERHEEKLSFSLLSHPSRLAFQNAFLKNGSWNWRLCVICKRSWFWIKDRKVITFILQLCMSSNRLVQKSIGSLHNLRQSTTFFYMDI